MTSNFKRPFFLYTLALVSCWTLIIAGLTNQKLEDNKQIIHELATSEARANFKKDTAFRLWATRHGRIYVPVDDNYSPDPFLKSIPDRDVTTDGGIKLTLINPARIVRELNENFSALYGVYGKVTSLDPLRPGNMPDEWEKQALKKLGDGYEEVMEYANINGKLHLRLMQPLRAEQNCLLCHSKLKVGDIGGGVGVSLPMDKLLAQQNSESAYDIRLFLSIWLIGTLGVIAGYFYLRREVTEKEQAINALVSSELRNSAIMRSALDSIITINAYGIVTEVNPATEKTFGYKREQMIGHDLADLIIPHDMRSHHNKQLANQLKTGESTILGKRVETTAINADGASFPIELAITRIDVEGSTLFTAYLRDMTEAYELKKELTYQAKHDSLTGLINRRAFEEDLIKIIGESSAGDHRCLLYLDLDQFKVINDSKGHVAGDELLRQLGQLLTEHVRTNDVLSRLGGDEFAILLEGCPIEKAREVASKLIESVKQYRFIWEDSVFNITVSIGMIPMYGRNINYTELMSAADVACYKAKEEGGNRYHVFHANDQDLADKRGEMSMIGQIQHALDADDFRLYKQNIQPIHDENKSGKMHCEILLRMKNDDGNIIGPDRFIPAAEKYNLMSSIDEWVVKNTLKWLSSIPDLTQKIELCSINLSGYSITAPSFLDFIKEQFDKYKVPTEIVCFEITETVAISNLVKAKKFMHELKKIGCLFALDDFGSGVSSFGYLKALPVDYIKIDGIFIRDIVTNEISRAMVKSINEIGKVMGKKTIAEFVENAEIVNILKEMEIDYAQGYYYSRPEPVDSN